MLDDAIGNVHPHSNIIGFQHRFDERINIFLKPTTCKIFNFVTLQHAFLFGCEMDEFQKLGQIANRCHEILDRFFRFRNVEIFPVAVVVTQSLHHLIVAAAQQVL